MSILGWILVIFIGIPFVMGFISGLSEIKPPYTTPGEGDRNVLDSSDWIADTKAGNTLPLDQTANSDEVKDSFSTSDLGDEMKSVEELINTINLRSSSTAKENLDVDELVSAASNSKLTKNPLDDWTKEDFTDSQVSEAVQRDNTNDNETSVGLGNVLKELGIDATRIEDEENPFLRSSSQEGTEADQLWANVPDLFQQIEDENQDSITFTDDDLEVFGGTKKTQDHQSRSIKIVTKKVAPHQPSEVMENMSYEFTPMIPHREYLSLKKHFGEGVANSITATPNTIKNTGNKEVLIGRIYVVGDSVLLKYGSFLPLVCRDDSLKKMDQQVVMIYGHLISPDRFFVEEWKEPEKSSELGLKEVGR